MCQIIIALSWFYLAILLLFIAGKKYISPANIAECKPRKAVCNDALEYLEIFRRRKNCLANSGEVRTKNAFTRGKLGHYSGEVRTKQEKKSVYSGEVRTLLLKWNV